MDSHLKTTNITSFLLIHKFNLVFYHLKYKNSWVHRPWHEKLCVYFLSFKTQSFICFIYIRCNWTSLCNDAWMFHLSCTMKYQILVIFRFTESQLFGITSMMYFFTILLILTNCIPQGFVFLPRFDLWVLSPSQVEQYWPWKHT